MVRCMCVCQLVDGSFVFNQLSDSAHIFNDDDGCCCLDRSIHTDTQTTQKCENGLRILFGKTKNFFPIPKINSLQCRIILNRIVHLLTIFLSVQSKIRLSIITKSNDKSIEMTLRFLIPIKND